MANRGNYWSRPSTAQQSRARASEATRELAERQAAQAFAAMATGHEARPRGHRGDGPIQVNVYPAGAAPLPVRLEQPAAEARPADRAAEYIKALLP